MPRSPRRPKPVARSTGFGRRGAGAGFARCEADPSHIFEGQGRRQGEARDAADRTGKAGARPAPAEAGRPGDRPRVFRRSVPPTGAQGRARARQPLSRCSSPSCSRRSRPMPASTRRRASSSPRRHAAKMLALGEDGVREHIKTHELLQHQGQERHRPVAPPRRGARRQGAGRSRSSRPCPASGARPRTSCSTSPSASRASPSTRISSASRTASRSRRDIRSTRRSARGIVPERVPAHAHHWLILHGRYVCKARRPECWRCLIRDLCRYGAEDARGSADDGVIRSQDLPPVPPFSEAPPRPGRAARRRFRALGRRRRDRRAGRRRSRRSTRRSSARGRRHDAADGTAGAGAAGRTAASTMVPTTIAISAQEGRGDRRGRRAWVSRTRGGRQARRRRR